MMIVSVNNEKKTVDDNTDIEQLLRLCGFTSEKVAVAVNTEFVPRSGYAAFILQANDRIDILAPVQGG